MDKNKISILSISLTSGGAEKVISLLLKKLVADYEVTLFLFYDNIHFPIPPGVRVIAFKKEHPRFYNPLIKVWEFLRFLALYNRYLKKYEIQYAVSFLASPNLINGITAIFKSKLVTIISERGYPSDNTGSKFSQWISKMFYPLLYNRCDKLFSNSTYINKDLKDHFGIKIPMAVIYNPIEISQVNAPEKIRKSKSDPLKIITAGTLNKRKNQKLIIKALKQVTFSYQFTVLGAGHLENELKKLVDVLDLSDCVTFEGAVKNVSDYLIENEIFVLSSFTEGFPNALLEAMSMGLACISTNCLSGPLELLHDGNPITIARGEIFEGDFGILINNDDELALIRALQLLHDNPSKKENYSKMGLLKSKEFELDSIYAQFKDFVQN